MLVRDLKEVGQGLDVAHVNLAEGEDLVGEQHQVCASAYGFYSNPYPHRNSTTPIAFV